MKTAKVKLFEVRGPQGTAGPTSAFTLLELLMVLAIIGILSTIALAFNGVGQLVSGRNDLIPLAKGNVLFHRDTSMPSVVPSPPGSETSSSFNVVSIDWLTGRARLERQEVQ